MCPKISNCKNRVVSQVFNKMLFINRLLACKTCNHLSFLNNPTRSLLVLMLGPWPSPLCNPTQLPLLLMVNHCTIARSAPTPPRDQTM
ncbi:hypothetical protein CEXT_429331 [Caerostris extrusa]|uniref:Uncharacterized protein n=1 Tax=Caerostris extrusa TaxID=172846 RepID=A0AAV4MU50_CAEEX|nr:hypothetical protein CEXT_429331 [Caerostris extrusa]